MQLGPLPRAALAALALLALGVGARTWPQPEFTPPPRALRPLPEDLCSAGREGACLAPGYNADELAGFYGLPPEAADRISVSENGAIRFEADRVVATD